jgi:transposase
MSYPSDLGDAEWKLIERHFRPKDRRGSASKHPRKRIVDAILYLAEGGIKWRMMPKDFPPWQTVCDHFSRRCKAGVWQPHRRPEPERPAPRPLHPSGLAPERPPDPGIERQWPAAARGLRFAG